ncbi:MAG: hypothetical protein HY927_07025 [Elusimicrobia bacterium]|nr:hypothetical protein [Elusimicrobiota bacterium]
MKRGVLAAAVVVLCALAGLGWRAARTHPGVPPPAAVSGPRLKLETLEDILRSRNDNDPRLDRDFNDLSPEAKRLFRRKYAELPPESRNDRGTIVYLLGKNLDDAEDWRFLRDVAGEPPCLNLAGCSTEPAPGLAKAFGEDVTLAYPSLVALKQAQRVLEGPPTPERRAEALAVVAAGKGSRMRAVADLAAGLERRFSP